MRIRGGKMLQRRLIKLHGSVVIAFHLGLIRVLKNFPRSCEGFPAHVAIFSTRVRVRQKYERPARARLQPVLCAGSAVAFPPANMENGLCCSAGRSLRSPAAFRIVETSSSTTHTYDGCEYARPGGI